MTCEDAIIQACAKDDVESLRQIVEQNHSATITTILQYGALKSAIYHNSLRALTCLLSLGLDLTDLGGSDVIRSKGALQPIFELLLAHGWDINTRSSKGYNSQPLLWCIVDDSSLVEWCLERGANVRLSGTYNRFSCPSLLEVAAQRTSVSIFELLRKRGADLGPRALHLAVSSVVFNSSSTDFNSTKLTKRYMDRIDMVVHLINNLKLDVNAWDSDASFPFGPLLYGTPLNYVSEACSSVADAHCRDVTWLLLDAGADQTRARHGTRAALDLPIDEGMIPFVQAIEEWNNRTNHVVHNEFRGHET